MKYLLAFQINWRSKRIFGSKLSGSVWEPNGSSEHHQKNQAEREGNANFDGVSCFFNSNFGLFSLSIKRFDSNLESLFIQRIGQFGENYNRFEDKRRGH